MRGKLLAVIVGAIAFGCFSVADMELYGRARFPQRMQHWYYKLPGGGIAAYYVEGPESMPPAVEPCKSGEKVRP